MTRHPLSEDLDEGLEYAHEQFSSADELDSSVEVGEVCATAEDATVTLSIDGSGDVAEYVATVSTEDGDAEIRDRSVGEVLDRVFRRIGTQPPEVTRTGADGEEYEVVQTMFDGKRWPAVLLVDGEEVGFETEEQFKSATEGDN